MNMGSVMHIVVYTGASVGVIVVVEVAVVGTFVVVVVGARREKWEMHNKAVQQLQ